MDETDKYLEMNIALEELQNDWTPIIGDVVAVDRDRQVGLAPADQCGTHIITTVNKKISMGPTITTYQLTRGQFPWHGAHQIHGYQMTWLPRQDQLQKLFDNKHSYSVPALDAALFSSLIHSNPYYLSFTTMEQLWLAFIAETLFNKCWNHNQNCWEPIETPKGE